VEPSPNCTLREIHFISDRGAFTAFFMSQSAPQSIPPPCVYYHALSDPPTGRRSSASSDGAPRSTPRWDSQYERKTEPARGVDPNAHPNGACPECGKDIGRDHNGARYCSDRCRQRAYRVRKAAAQGRNSPVPKRSRKTIVLAGGVYELRLKKPRRSKKCLVGPQSDTSIHADNETNVTAGDGTVA
jgi:hypothetical protein